MTDCNSAESGRAINRPEVAVETLDFRGSETHRCSIEGEVTRHYYECPNPDCETGFMCTWMDCPDCLWYDEDVWERTLDETEVVT